jgi:ABC-type lipoprotein export system ATPase subunit
MASAHLELRDVRFRYRDGDFALRIPELRVAPGAQVAVIGPSGSGKTTLLHLVAGIALPEEGVVTTSGVEVSALDDASRRDFRIKEVGLVFQEFELLEYLGVLDNVLLPYRLNPVLRLDGDVRARAVRLAERVGLGHALERRVTRLSHGERQRVAVARALVTQPAVLLADEPTGNLDPANKGLVLDLLFEVAGEHDATLLVVTHDHDLLERFARVIDIGKLIGGTG